MLSIQVCLVINIWFYWHFLSQTEPLLSINVPGISLSSLINVEDLFTEVEYPGLFSATLILANYTPSTLHLQTLCNSSYSLC